MSWQGHISHYESEGEVFQESRISISVPYPRDPQIAMYATTLANAAATGAHLDMPELPQALVYILNLCEELDWDAIGKSIDMHAEIVPVLRASLERMIDRLPTP